VAGVSDDERHPDEYCGRAPRLGSILAIAVIALAALLGAGCGSSGGEFEAQEFIDRVNEHGAGLELGAPLDSTKPGAELHEVNLAPEDGEAGEPELGAEHGGGTLTVLDSEEEAAAEHARCDEAGLFCYRADNVVLLFEPEVSAQSLAKVASAFKALQAE